MSSVERSETKEKYHESNAGDGTRAIDQHLKGVKLYLTLFSCVVTLFLVALDQTIVSTILSKVGNQFNAFEKVGWLTSGFFLPEATLAPSYGKISIAFGRKYTTLTGIAVFMVGSLVAALSNSMGMLIAGRVVQGIGGGAIQSMVQVVLTEVVPISQRSLVYILIGITYSVSSVLGPFIGGALAMNVSWRWCFYINLPIGGAAAVCFVFCFNPPKTEGDIWKKLAKIDYIGTFLLTSGLVLVLIGLTFGGVEYEWKSAAIICFFVIGGLLLMIFGYYNFMISSKPILLKEIVMVPQIMAASLASMFNFSFFLVEVTYLSVYFQVVFSASSLQTGIDLIPMILAVAIASVLNGSFIRITRNVKITMLISGLLGPIGCGLLLLFSDKQNLGQRIGFFILLGVPIGLQFQSGLISCQLRTPNNTEGSLIMVTVFVTFARTLGATLFVTVGQLIYQTSGSAYLSDLKNSLTKDSEFHQIMEKIPTSSFIDSPEVIDKLPKELQKLIRKKIVLAVRDVMYLGLALACAALICCLFSTNRRVPKQGDVLTKEDDEKTNTSEESR